MECAFRRTVVDISHALSAYDLEQIIYIFAIPEQGTKITPLSVLKRLEREGQFSATKPEGLEKLLQDIHRNDLSGRVSDYCSRFKHVNSCCRFSSCRRLTELAELCFAQANNTNQGIKDLTQDLDRFSRNHRKTPTTEKFCQEMGENFKRVQSDFDSFLVSPLRDLHQLVAAGSTDTTEKEVSAVGNKPPPLMASVGTKLTTSLSQPILDQFNGPMEDYDILEPNGMQDKFGGKPLTSTRIPVPIRKGSGQTSLIDSSPVLSARPRGVWGSPQRGRGRDSLLSTSGSADDSGFAEWRHSHRSAGGGRNDSLSHTWRESRVYTSLDLATANEHSEYERVRSRHRK